MRLLVACRGEGERRKLLAFVKFVKFVNAAAELYERLGGR